VRGDHLDALFCEFSVEWITVVRPVADQALWSFFDETVAERSLDELRFMSLTTSNPHGDRETVAVCHCHELGRLAASSFSNESAPLLPPRGSHR